MLIKCPHCSKPFDTEEPNRCQERNIEVIDDHAVIESYYVCPHCRGSVRGEQRSYDIPMWYEEEFEAV